MQTSLCRHPYAEWCSTGPYYHGFADSTSAPPYLREFFQYLQMTHPENGGGAAVIGHRMDSTCPGVKRLVNLGYEREKCCFQT
jgi:hypothetical protein